MAKNLPKTKVYKIPKMSDLNKHKRFTGNIQPRQGADSRQRNTRAESINTHFTQNSGHIVLS